MMQVLIVTGGIGSGKSEVCRIIQDAFDCGVYNADARVKMLYDNHPSLLDDIEAELGTALRDSDGKFLPSRLAQCIFNDKEKLQVVEGLVFPALIEDFELWKAGYADDDFVVFESATVLEKPQFKGFGDKVILVDAPFQTRLERASRRDGVAKNMIYSRMMNQVMMNKISDGEINPGTDAVIHNDCALDELHQQVLLTIERLYGKIN